MPSFGSLKVVKKSARLSLELFHRDITIHGRMNDLQFYVLVYGISVISDDGFVIMEGHVQ